MTPEELQAPAKPAPAAEISEPQSTERSGQPQAAETDNTTPAQQEQATAAEPSAADTAAVATTQSPEEAAASAAPVPQVEKILAPAPDMTAFIAALAAAERANENLAARLAQIEASAALQRERDQAFIRDMIKGVLLLAGTMASVGMLALVAIVYLQVRSTKQQAITFAAQLQALSSHIALPAPSGAPSVALHTAQNDFDSTARKIEQRLSDLESMTSGLPDSTAHNHGADSPPTELHHAAVEYTAPQTASTAASNGERTGDLLSKANSLLMQQQPEVALAYIDQAIGKNPRNPEAHLKRGAALERLNRLNEAITSYDRAIDAEPTLSVAFLAKAGVLNKLQRYAEALKCYEAALAQQGGQAASGSPAA
ncbi:MAG TPA: tetratricopeptide repeat protein [Opitutaceae bacterium]|nr:tetratricopeptide repeat protein [Opitutaceae bacterium]